VTKFKAGCPKYNEVAVYEGALSSISKYNENTGKYTKLHDLDNSYKVKLMLPPISNGSEKKTYLAYIYASNGTMTYKTFDVLADDAEYLGVINSQFATIHFERFI
jgi:hypothetical protein